MATQTNYASNPKAASAATYWTAGGTISVARQNAGGPNGEPFIRATPTATISNGAGVQYGATADPGLSASPGDHFAARISVRTTVSTRVSIYIQFLSSTGTTLLSTLTAYVTGAATWAELTHSTAAAAPSGAPASTARVRVLIYVTTGVGNVALTTADYIDATRLLVVRDTSSIASPPAYFDGDTPDVAAVWDPYSLGIDYAWTGAANASPSTADDVTPTPPEAPPPPPPIQSPVQIPRPPTPFEILVYDKTLTRVGFIGNPVSVTVLLQHNQIGTAEVVIDTDHPQVTNLTAAGSRLVINFKGLQVFSGWTKNITGSRAGDLTVTADDDLSVLFDLFGYPSPANDITSQPAKSDDRSGPAETVIKGYVAANLGRLVQPLTVAADQGRGAATSSSFRMVPLSDKLLDLADAAGVGISVRQVGQQLVLDCYTPRVYPRPLSEAGGTILDWEWSQTGPAATRAIIGGPNTGTSREWKGATDTARESAYGRTIETLVDAGSFTLVSDIIKAGTDALADSGPTSGFKVELGETSAFSYGPTGVSVGDQVTMIIGPASISDVLRSAQLTWAVDGGLSIAPQLGERSDDPDTVLAKQIVAIAKAIRENRSR